MTREETLEYIPEHLSDENKQRLRELTVESEPPAADLLVHADFLRGIARALLLDESRTADAIQDTWLAAIRRPPAREGK